MSKNREMKAENIHMIRSCFYRADVCTKQELMDETGMSQGGTTNVLQYLLERGEILLDGEAASTGGRRSKRYILNPNFQHIGSVILKKTTADYSILIASYDLCGNCVVSDAFHFEKGTLQDLDETVETLLRRDGHVKSLVISLPGVCDGGIVDICDFEQLVDLNLIDHFQKAHDIPVTIENDVNVAAIGFADELYVSKNVAVIYQPAVDYIGCGIVLQGRLYNGSTHAAGELRYLPAYSHAYQEEMLKKDPKKLLSDQIVSLCAVLNPHVIGWYSDVFADELDLDAYAMPKKHKPQLIRIDGLDELIQKGLFYIGKDNILTAMKGM